MKKVLKIALVLILLLTILNLGKKVYFMGDQIERDKVLTATIWQLSKEGYTKDDIKSINSVYNPFGGVFPYSVEVIFYEDQSVMKFYTWDNESKTTVSCEESRCL